MSDTILVPLSHDFKFKVEKALVRYKALQRQHEAAYSKAKQEHNKLVEELKPKIDKIFEQWDGVDYKLTPKYKTVHGFFGDKKVRDGFEVTQLDTFDTNGRTLEDFVSKYWEAKCMPNTYTELQVQNLTFTSLQRLHGDITSRLLHTGFFHVGLFTKVYLKDRKFEVDYLSDLLSMFDSVEGKEISMSVSNYNKYFKEV